MQLEEIFSKLWEQYSTDNPSVKKIHTLFENEGESIVNDHVAFRTFNHSKTNIDVVAKPFLKAGYRPAGEYDFPQKKLFARHYELAGMPRVFISELKTEAFSEDFQRKINNIIAKTPAHSLDSDHLIVSGNIFGQPSYEIYEYLRKESEYAAWVYAFGYRANHFTVSVNHLKKYKTIEQVNSFIKQNGFEMNTSGGEVKGTPDIMLQQSSTLADKINVEFLKGMQKIPSCYYEFALRFPDKNGELFGGFIAGSADKIFESTDLR